MTLQKNHKLHLAITNIGSKQNNICQSKRKYAT